MDKEEYGVHTYSVRKKNEIMAFLATEMELDIIILSKVSQIEIHNIMST